jgi:spoIIIJ-associated protein
VAHAEASARTVEAAVTAAAAQLGLRSDQVDIEVLADPVPSTFGYIGTPARVRVTSRSASASSPPPPADPTSTPPTAPDAPPPAPTRPADSGSASTQVPGRASDPPLVPDAASAGVSDPALVSGSAAAQAPGRVSDPALVSDSGSSSDRVSGRTSPSDAAPSSGQVADSAAPAPDRPSPAEGRSLAGDSAPDPAADPSLSPAPALAPTAAPETATPETGAALTTEAAGQSPGASLPAAVPNHSTPTSDADSPELIEPVAGSGSGVVGDLARPQPGAAHGSDQPVAAPTLQAAPAPPPQAPAADPYSGAILEPGRQEDLSAPTPDPETAGERTATGAPGVERGPGDQAGSPRPAGPSGAPIPSIATPEAAASATAPDTPSGSARGIDGEQTSEADLATPTPPAAAGPAVENRSLAVSSEPRSRPSRRTYRDEPIEPEMVEADTERAGDFLEGLLDALDVDGDITTWVDEVGGHVDLEGSDLNILVGSNGETLDALQELTRLAVLRQSKRRVRLLLDINGFRVRQREQLVAVVKTTVEQVIKTREPHEFQPMTPAERKIVHDAVAAMDGVLTESLGEDPHRRVVIRPA